MTDIIQVGIIPFDAPAGGETFNLLKEDADAILKEDGDNILTEDAV